MAAPTSWRSPRHLQGVGVCPGECRLATCSPPRRATTCWPPRRTTTYSHFLSAHTPVAEGNVDNGSASVVWGPERGSFKPRRTSPSSAATKGEKFSDANKQASSTERFDGSSHGAANFKAVTMGYISAIGAARPAFSKDATAAAPVGACSRACAKCDRLAHQFCPHSAKDCHASDRKAAQPRPTSCNMAAILLAHGASVPLSSSSSKSSTKSSSNSSPGTWRWMSSDSAPVGKSHTEMPLSCKCAFNCATWREKRTMSFNEVCRHNKTHPSSASTKKRTSTPIAT
mmetsp:Transcript_96248/g.294385  ORF Transcript_96248/g.294385 Transcript_96248/m.294385 type:complete len:285 (-) Transcript_96248:548-1402(-)